MTKSGDRLEEVRLQSTGKFGYRSQEDSGTALRKIQGMPQSDSGTRKFDLRKDIVWTIIVFSLAREFIPKIGQ